MKLKADVIVNMDKMVIHSIDFKDEVLNSCNQGEGKVRLNKFFKKKILQVPLKEFIPYYDASSSNRYVKLETIIDVYPYIWKVRNPVHKRPHPYKCVLYPYPVLKHNHISFEDYSALQSEVLKVREKKNYSTWKEELPLEENPV